MKKNIIAMAVAIMVSSVAMAQDDQKKRDGKRPDKTELIKNRTDETVKKYGLDEQQAQQLQELNTQYAEKLGRGFGQRGRNGGHHGMQRPADGQRRQPQAAQRPQLTDEQKAQMEQERKQRAENMKAYDAELQKILTPEQYKAYKADQEKQRPQGGPRGPRQRGFAGGADTK